MMGKTTTSPVSSPRRKRKKKGDDFKDDGNKDEKGVDEIAKRVKLCASITGKGADAKEDADDDAVTVLASTSSYAEMNSVLKRVHFEAKERWERRRATRAEADGMK